MAEQKKDYLSSLASEIEKKPDSFKEEKVERIVKPKRSVDPNCDHRRVFPVFCPKDQG